MNHIEVVPDAVRAYGSASAAMAAGVASAGAVDQAATIATVVPVFGLIGQEFLASFAFAQANHLSSVAELAAVHAGTALTAHQAASTYEVTDGASGAAIGSVSSQS
ncbi:type VII secretion target [Nocardia suismassiliense]|uniref:Type VII secretion target n=1 Tax=Nocardia suismassiliense TaxID=2077092 RepID=A0ABW6QVP6_9NOCA|nr:type VII secretion target [Nocardia sp. XZ_19_369]